MRSLSDRLGSFEARMREREGSCDKRKQRTLWLSYTGCFVIIAFAALFVYPSNGRSIVWSVDGLEQYYPFFVYEGQWLREVFSGLINGHGLVLPVWEFALGYGSDIFVTIDAFVDPLNLLSGLCPEAYSEYLFQFLIVLRLYLAGVAFIIFSRFMGAGRFPVLCGALLYALCATSMAVLHWPAGVWPMILFPLLLLGVEKILQHKKPFVFIFAIMAFCIISYYFAYMACLLLLLYCAVRVCMVVRPLSVLRFLGWTAKFLGFCLIGIALAGVILVPSVMALLSIDRISSSEVVVPLLYASTYYQSLVGGFLGYAGAGSDCLIGFGGIALVSCVLLFARRKSNTVLKVFFVAMSLGLLIPLVGSVFNGFNYATNRWVWAYALCISSIVVAMVPILLSLEKREIRILLLAAGVCAALLFFFQNMRTEVNIASFAVMLGAVIALTLPGTTLLIKKVSIVCFIGMGITCTTFYIASPNENGWGVNSSPIASLHDKITSDSPNHLVADLDDESAFWRYDGDPTATVRTRNASLTLGLNGIDFYNSVYNNDIDKFHSEMGLVDTAMNASYRCLDGRSQLLALMGVKYLIAPDAPTTVLPYNYKDPSQVVNTGIVRQQPYSVFEGTSVLPLGFAYDTVIPRSAYDAMTPIQKQEALMQGVVLEEDVSKPTSVEISSKEVPFKVANSSGLTFEDGLIRATSPNSWMTITFEGVPDAETYLYFENLEFAGISPLNDVVKEDYDRLAWYQKAWLQKQEFEWEAVKFYEIYVDGGASRRKINNYTSSDHLYGGKDDWLLNLGYTQEAQKSMTLHFPQDGAYSFNELQVLCQPMGTYHDRVEKLQADVMENIQIGANEVTATIDLPKDKTLFMSIPYSTGWSAFVDGEPTELKKANTAFMALSLDAGSHDIRLAYETPGLRAGMAVTSGGLLALVAVALVYRIRKKPTTAGAVVVGPHKAGDQDE